MDKSAEKKGLAAVVAIGDELLTGLTVDSNSAWLSRQLARLGVPVVRHVTVPDHAAATAAAVAQCARMAGWVILTGGLGPTPDDLTRQAVADLLREPLALRREALAQIQARFDRMGRKMAQVNRVQAQAPPSASMLSNEMGTAPGLRFTFDGADCFCLPGVPAEMRAMFQSAVAPALRDRSGAAGPSPAVAGYGRTAGGVSLLTRTLHTFGMGESDLAERLGELLARGRNPQIGTTASAGLISVRIYARGRSSAEAEALLDDAARQLIDRLGDLCFGADEQTLPAVVGEQLRSAGQTLALAESCTGGLLAELMTSVPGSSDYFLESVVSYANASKVSRLGVRAEDIETSGAVSEPVAAQMAVGARERSGADWALSLTGIAGPSGGGKDKPVGLVFIGLAGPDGVAVRRHVFSGDRVAVRLRAAHTALNWLRLATRPKPA